MKRFGLPMLLSAGYASLLFLVFSSDFSKEHSFLLKESDHLPRAKALEKPSENREYGLADRVALMNIHHLELAASPIVHPVGAEQSPESAGNTQP